MYDYALTFITVLHYIFLMFVVITPFTNSNYFLTLHAFVIPFMVLHWIIENDTCALTVAEIYIREQMGGAPVDKTESFVHRIVGPVYNFNCENSTSKTSSFMIYLVTLVLWLLTINKLYKKYQNGEISEYQDLFII